MDSILDGIFESWKKDLYENIGQVRFSANGRKEPLYNLVDMLVEKNIDYNDAHALSHKIKGCLVTKKGSLGTGNYKNWKENVESEFKAILYEAYNAKGLIPIEESKTPTSTKYEPLSVVSERHPLIEIWGKNRFGEAWCEELEVLTNTPDSSLHNLFLDEFFS